MMEVWSVWPRSQRCCVRCTVTSSIWPLLTMTLVRRLLLWRWPSIACTRRLNGCRYPGSTDRTPSSSAPIVWRAVAIANGRMATISTCWSKITTRSSTNSRWEPSSKGRKKQLTGIITTTNLKHPAILTNP